MSTKNTSEILELFETLKAQKNLRRAINDAVYPRFYGSEDGKTLTAVLSKTKCVHIMPSGMSGYGFDFRIYKTRRMVLKFGDSYRPRLTEDQFFESLMNLILSYFTHSKEFGALMQKRRNSQLQSGKDTKLLN